MRTLLFAVAAFSAVLTAQAFAEGSDQFGPNPFPVERGSALPPPPIGETSQAAPPEGQSPAGLDFGQWRSAEPAAYGQRFLAQVRERFAGQGAAAIRADLERNGFACQDESRLACRIEIMERQCAIDWYVVIERASADPIAGFDKMCLGAL